MPAKYSVNVTKDFLVFSAAHFITFAGDQCERLHGHNYRVDVAVDGPLDENQYVVDFIALRDWTKSLTDSLDHRVLLPTQSRLIEVSQSGDNVEVRFRDRTWSFPVGDCVLLPVANTTAELLARWIAAQLAERMTRAGNVAPETLRVRVEENFGQWATCTLEPDLM